MRTVALVMLFAASAFAQVSPAGDAAACGLRNISFKVRLDESQHTQPELGKAQVYFIQDSGTTQTLGSPTIKVAMDGVWVGANHTNSYFSVSVGPGEHHVCVMMQYPTISQHVELAHFTAEAEKVYYYRTRLISGGVGVVLIDLSAIDSDQGKYLVATFPLSISSPKK